jgi:ERCC4-type nuclease
MSIVATLIDIREPNWIKQLAFGGIPTVVTYLEYGDVMAACDDGNILLFERKTPGDYLNTLRDGRLFPQLAEMLLVTRWSYLIVTGDFLRGPGNKVITDQGETGWNWDAVMGSLLTIQEMGIFVVHCANDMAFESTILRIGNRDRKPELLLAPPKFPKILSAQEAIVASLPGIGIERLQAVMSHCGTAAWSLVALTDPTSSIPGIGQGVKTRIRAALGLKNDQQLVLHTDDDNEGPTDTELLKIVSIGDQ